jgi:hypothetical protein
MELDKGHDNEVEKDEEHIEGRGWDEEATKALGHQRIGTISSQFLACGLMASLPSTRLLLLKDCRRVDGFSSCAECAAVLLSTQCSLRDYWLLLQLCALAQNVAIVREVFLGGTSAWLAQVWLNPVRI